MLVSILDKLDSETYRKHLVFENENKVIYGVVLRETYVMLVLVILFYKNFYPGLEMIRF